MQSAQYHIAPTSHPSMMVNPRPHSFDENSLHHGQHDWRTISRRLNRCQSEYLVLGVKYYALTSQIRDDKLDDSTRDRFENLFEKTSEGKDPDIIGYISNVRQLREEMREALWVLNFDGFKDKLDVAEGTLENSIIPAIVDATFSMDHVYESVSMGPGFASEDYQKAKEWVLSLPEVQYQIQNGMATEQQAFEAAVISVEVYETDFEDDESEVSSTQCSTPAKADEEWISSQYMVAHSGQVVARAADRLQSFVHGDMQVAIDEVEGAGEPGEHKFYGPLRPALRFG